MIMHISLKPVITHVSASNGMKIPKFLKKIGGMMLYLSNAPLN